MGCQVGDLNRFLATWMFDGTPGPDRKQPVDLEYLKLRKLGTRKLEITRNHHQDLLLWLWFHGVLKKGSFEIPKTYTHT